MAEKNKTRTVYIQPTTGGQVEIKVSPETTVNSLKRVVANRLKVSKDRIVLLHKNRQLVEGNLQENSVAEGARLTLLPSVETGIVSQRPEHCVMQALESLNDTQVDSFLAGRAPLNLTMRLGDHMMFVQLQLSTGDSSKDNTATPQNSASLPTPPTTPTTPNSPTSPLLFPPSSAVVTPNVSSPPSPPPSPKHTVQPPEAEEPPRSPSINAKILAEASRNLTHTLRQLSSTTLSKKMNERCDGRCCTMARQGGAVIESMFHHGRGVYSGTFSGTLSPFLQDKDGRPRRDVSTVVHILSDLLGASSHCRPSAQCLCSPTATTSRASQSDSQATSSIKVKIDGQNQEENDMLRQKMQRIQSMLEERREKRKARRTTPYPTTSQAVNSSATVCQSSISSTASMSPDNSEQTIVDYSSETAVA